MYRIFSIIILFCFVAIVGAGNSLNVNLLQGNCKTILLECSVDSLVLVNDGSIVSDEHTYIYQENNTALPYFTRIIYSTSKDVIISGINYKEFKQKVINLNKTKGRRKGDSFYFDSNIDNIIKESHCFKTKEGLFAHVLKIYPYSYTLSTQVLEICNAFSVAIVANGGCFVIPKQPTKFDIQKSTLKRSVSSKNVKSIGVVYHDSFFEEILPYVEWKTLKGYRVFTMPYSKFSSVKELKDSLLFLYNYKDLGYLVLVGDHEHIPALENMGSSDASYGFLLNDDFYPEIAVGRFSATTIEELHAQIQKSIAYEKHNFGNWQNKFALIASEEGPGDNNERDYEHMNVIKTLLESNGLLATSQLYDGTLSHGDLDAIGDPSSSMVNAAINDSIGLMLYMGHGSIGTFTTSSYKNESVAGLTNDESFPFALVGGCQVGNFNGNTCLAESFMRAQNNGKPTGLSLIWAAAEDQDWDPPMYAQDVFISELVKDNSLKIFGDLAVRCSNEMNIKFDEYGFSTTSTWVTFGDPTLQLFTLSAGETQATMPTQIRIDKKSLDVYIDTDGLFSIIQNGKRLNSVYVTSGLSSVAFPSLQSKDNLIVCFSANNRKPLIDTVKVLPAFDGFVVARSIVIEESSSNGIFNAGDNCSFSLVLKNEGLGLADNVAVSIASDSEYVTFLGEKSISLAPFSFSEEISLNNIFKCEISEDIPNRSEVTFTISVYSNNNVVDFKKTISVSSPELKIVDVQFLPSQASDDDSLPEPGEIMNVALLITNNNIAKNAETICSFESESKSIEVITSTLALNSIEKGKIDTLSFLVKFPDVINVGQAFSFHFYSNYFDTVVAIKPYSFVESWENIGDYYSLNLNYLYPWVVDTEQSYDGIKSFKSGNISDSQESTFSILLNCTADDSLSFYVKTSCESETAFGSEIDWYDYLEFSIDGESVARWAGETDWQRNSFAVGAGTHTFTWNYVKDESLYEGRDAAWIDYISLPSFLPKKDTLMVNEAPFLADTTLLFVLDSANTIHIISKYSVDSIALLGLDGLNWLSASTQGNTILLRGQPSIVSQDSLYATYFFSNGVRNRKLYFNYREPEYASELSIAYSTSYSYMTDEIFFNRTPERIQVISAQGLIVYDENFVEESQKSLQFLPKGWFSIKITYNDAVEYLYIVRF